MMVNFEVLPQLIQRFFKLIVVATCVAILVTGCSRAKDKPKVNAAKNNQSVAKTTITKKAEKEDNLSDKQKIQNESVGEALRALIFEGPELHESLRTREVSLIKDLTTGIVSPENPHVSTEDDFVQSVSRGSSQGRLDRNGILAALYARYSTGENELGFYGLLAKSESEADDREESLREIWAHNGSHGRSRVHRNGLVLLVIWHDGLPMECWSSVNDNVIEKFESNSELKQ